VIERIASSIYRQGEQARDAGVLQDAVTHFLRVSAAAPQSLIASTAEYDAAAVLIQLQEWQRATVVLEGFRQRYPDHELNADVTAKLAVSYLEAGDRAHAAREFERIADQDGDLAVRKEALWRAGELFRESGQAVAASAAFERYVERHPEPIGEAIEARLLLADLAEAQGNQQSRFRWLDEIVTADATAGEARTDRTRYLAATSQLELAEPARNAFRGVRLAVPLPDSLAKKRERMELALDAYGKAAEYGVTEVTTAATYEIADLYHTLSKDLFDSERPAELSAAELAQYDILLEEQAYPFEEEAIDVHEINAQRTAEGIYDEWVDKSIAALAELMPARYAKEEVGEYVVDAIR
jgi:tetratricopeptide (TPR) repeat protein